MCLTANRFRPFLITLRRRKVYKVLMSRDKGELVTPFVCKKINDDNIEALEPIEILRCGRCKHIGIGMIHSYTDMKLAIISADLLKCDYTNWRSLADFIVYEAIIPPFTLYLKGCHGDIASRRLKLIKEVYKI